MFAEDFTELVAKYGQPIARYFARRAAPGDVEDLTADVLATAWAKHTEIPEGFELPWLYRTAGFVLANHRRKIVPFPSDDLPEASSGEDVALNVVTDDALRRALKQLSDKDREVLLLAAWDGLDGVQLGAALGLSRGGAAAALSRARARFADALAIEEGAGDETTG